MSKNRWFKTSFLLTVLIFIIIGMANYIIDPFHQYRVNTFYPISYITKLARYTNPGFAKNCNYDTINLGSSTSANTIPLNIKKILNFDKPINLSIDGTSAYEESITLNTALKHKKVKNVIYGLDSALFWGLPRRIKHGEKSFPFHLYDDNILNDYKYIFSLDTTVKSLKTIVSFVFDKHNDIQYDYDRMYQWQSFYTSNDFSIKHVMADWSKRENISYHVNSTLKFYKKSFDYNFLTTIKQYPTTNFIIYFPPYSMLYYKLEKERKLFQERLMFKRYIFDTTKKLPNVQIYDFQIAKNITHNLSNYRDIVHYHQRINNWILKQIKDKNFKINEENINFVLDEHKHQVNSYEIKEDNK